MLSIKTRDVPAGSYDHDHLENYGSALIFSELVLQ